MRALAKWKRKKAKKNSRTATVQEGGALLMLYSGGDVKVESVFLDVLEFSMVEFVRGSCLHVAFLRKKLLNNKLVRFSIGCHRTRRDRKRLLRHFPNTPSYWWFHIDLQFPASQVFPFLLPSSQILIDGTHEPPSFPGRF